MKRFAACLFLTLSACGAEASGAPQAAADAVLARREIAPDFTVVAVSPDADGAGFAALAREMKGLDVEYNKPAGGMFLWLRLPARTDAAALLPAAVERGVAFVPGAPFYAGESDPRTLRLSFVTATVEEIDFAIAALGALLREHST